MSRPRDSQRQKVWRAFRDAQKNFVSDEVVEHPMKYIKHLCQSKWFFKRLTWITTDRGVFSSSKNDLSVIYKNRKNTYTYNGLGTIFISVKDSYKESDMLMLACHAAFRRRYADDYAGHGREFVKFFIDVLKHFIGKTNADVMKVSCNNFHVKYSMKKAGSKPRLMPLAAIEALQKYRAEKRRREEDEALYGEKIAEQFAADRKKEEQNATG